MTPLKKIFVVNGDQAQRAALAEHLGRQGLATEFAGAAVVALEIVQRRHFDILMLDVELPDMDGRELCRMMRRHGVRAPIVMLARAASEADLILGLDAGASDYVTKPFHLGVLLARVRAQLREYTRSDHAVFAVGPYNFRPSAKLLTADAGKKKVRLTDKETALLKCLLRSVGQVASREHLLEEIWGRNAGVTAHALQAHIYRLRQKIESDPYRAELLITEPEGYRLTL